MRAKSEEQRINLNDLLKKAKEQYGDKINVAHDLFEEYVPEEKFDCVLCTHVSFYTCVSMSYF